MKATDLMIGDWVYVNGLTQQVFDLAYNQNEKELTVGVLDPQGDVYQCFYGFDHVEPIPLTGEILEKNGFVNGILRVFATPFLRQRVWSKVEVYEYRPYRVGKQINAYRLMIGGKESSGVDIHINHVHELQHAFRLCGIEKEIKL